MAATRTYSSSILLLSIAWHLILFSARSLAQPGDSAELSLSPPGASSGSLDVPAESLSLLPSPPEPLTLLPGADPVLDADSAAFGPAQTSWETILQLARSQRQGGSPVLAAQTLESLLESSAPEEFKRAALLEMALTAQDQRHWIRAQEIFAQFLHRFPQDPVVPEVLLRQGFLYREMALPNMAITKFYSVMTASLTLKLGEISYYKRLVLQAQAEIADTYYQEGRYDEARDFLQRLLKLNAPGFNPEKIHFKLIRCLDFLGQPANTVREALLFLQRYPDASDILEVRFTTARALLKLGKNHEAIEQVVALLDTQPDSAPPGAWILWKQRAGNEVANQLYQNGDYLNALQIYLHIAKLNPALEWQLPIAYQMALVFERLRQFEKAEAEYDRILAAQPTLDALPQSQSLLTLIEMAAWRKSHIHWLLKSEPALHALRNEPSATTP